MDRLRYPRAFVILHWVTFVLVLIAIAFIYYRHYLSPATEKAFWMSLHMSTGLLIFFLGIVRISVKWKVRAPASVRSTMSLLFLRKLVHFSIYASLIVMPLLGLASAWLRGRPFVFFELFRIPSPIESEWQSPIGKLLEHVHMYAAYIFLGLVSVHACAAIFHHMVLRDDVLRRMTIKIRRNAKSTD